MDRNNVIRPAIDVFLAVSLSARRAWIEMKSMHAEKQSEQRRSPQGERG